VTGDEREEIRQRISDAVVASFGVKLPIDPPSKDWAEIGRQRSALVRARRKNERLERELKEERQRRKEMAKRVSALERRVDALLGVGGKRAGHG
jgi:chromosome condensin MukBEF ATPase and DNA-binding subunit MukB